MHIHPASRVAAGIFRAAYDLYEDDCLSDYERDYLDELLCWFDKHLPVPDRFFCNGRKTYIRHGVCWFKTSARAHLARSWEMVALLESHGVWIQRLTARRPGLLLYEDDWQIVAVPSLPKRR